MRAARLTALSDLFGMCRPSRSTGTAPIRIEQ